MLTDKGICKHCGQLVAIQVDYEMTETELNEEATRNCLCEMARNERAIINAIDEAIEEVDEMFPERAEIRNYIKDTINLVGREVIDNVEVKIDTKTKATIKKTPKGKIRVERTVKNTESREH